MPHDKGENEIERWADSPETALRMRSEAFWTWEGFFSHVYDPTLHMAIVVIEVLLLESIEPFWVKIGVAIGVLLASWYGLIWLNVKREQVMV